MRENTDISRPVFVSKDHEIQMKERDAERSKMCWY